ncbi:hypothetical protein LTR70_003440 [Exophiala xenobiotica]|uniref:F-box domain-containing protein n=1 Tax=Lithohypha guttulata TaxID=1690604 RepID=A0ABR0KG95_9EURO|nr:hypothetical protein LTR24_002987 [Lithohypha guttulata]KAK5322978.1 hypothetical protein LTR70_003440 [Exophiala xenobiotica]
MASTTTTSFALPPEIVLLILEVLHHDSYKTLLASLYVDKTWSQLATQVLYRDLSLCPTSTRYFTNTAHREHLECSLSITVDIGVDNEGYLINRLRPHLSAMHNLLSFSFLGSFDGDNDTESQGMVELVRLLEALPISVQYLELLVPYRLSSPKYHHGHLCPLLSRILPRLRGLRLESTTICRSLFESLQENCQHLKDITIQSITGNFIQHKCTDSERLLYQDYSAINNLLAAARRSVEAGQFPAARNFNFCGYRFAGYLDNPEEFDCLYTADVLGNATTAYPVDNHYVFQGSWMLYSDASQKEIEYVGNINKLSKLVEGAENWLVATHGAHLPYFLKRKRHYQWTEQADVRVIARDTDREAGTAAARLRRREKRTGRKLLQVEAKSGLRVPDHPRYRVPIGADDDEEGDG